MTFTGLSTPIRPIFDSDLEIDLDLSSSFLSTRKNKAIQHSLLWRKKGQLDNQNNTSLHTTQKLLLLVVLQLVSNSIPDFTLMLAVHALKVHDLGSESQFK